MIKPLLTEEDLRGMATQFSSALLMTNPSQVFENMFEAIRAQRQKHAKIFGGYDPVLLGNRPEWVSWASGVEREIGAPRLSSELSQLFAHIEREAVTEMLRVKSSTVPEGVPMGYLMRAIDDKGFNIGYYTFNTTDRHVWIPAEEAAKERPDLTHAIEDAPIRQALSEKRSARLARLIEDQDCSPQ